MKIAGEKTKRTEKRENPSSPNSEGERHGNASCVWIEKSQSQRTCSIENELLSSAKGIE